MELFAPNQGVQPGRFGNHTRRRLVLLLRHQLKEPIQSRSTVNAADNVEKRMKKSLKIAALHTVIILLGSYLALAQQPAQQNNAQTHPMTFFVTSVGLGKGADLSGLTGADAHCQALATAVGAGNHAWHAYLSTQAMGGQPAVNARDRIGQGPWVNAKGQQIAANVAELHGDTLELARLGNRIGKTTAITEKGEMAKGVGDTPNQHDILTGSQPDG